MLSRSDDGVGVGSTGDATRTAPDVPVIDEVTVSVAVTV
jgi:hypothetical protein